MLNSFYVLSHFEKLHLKSRLNYYFILASCYIRITAEDTKLGQCRSKLTLLFWPQLKLASPPHTTFPTWTSAEHSPRLPLYLNLTNNLIFSVLKIVFIKLLSNDFIFYFFQAKRKSWTLLCASLSPPFATSSATWTTTSTPWRPSEPRRTSSRCKKNKIWKQKTVDVIVFF